MSAIQNLKSKLAAYKSAVDEVPADGRSSMTLRSRLLTAAKELTDAHRVAMGEVVALAASDSGDTRATKLATLNAHRATAGLRPITDAEYDLPPEVRLSASADGPPALSFDVYCKSMGNHGYAATREQYDQYLKKRGSAR